jgi:endonuclease/exonuclease/phosphatase family metal-dependent hydrolase
MADHGQERTCYYTLREKRSVQTAVAEVYRGASGNNESTSERHETNQYPVELESSDWLRRRKRETNSVPSNTRKSGKTSLGASDRSGEVETTPSPQPSADIPLQPLVDKFWNAAPDASKPITVAVGPLGYIYWPNPLDAAETERIARRLVSEARIPLVLAPIDGTVWAWNKTGRYRMPDEAAEVLAPDHPHLPDVAHDLTKLCFHADAGQFLISGWQNDQMPVSFVGENGAHGGPGPRETSGFFIVPPDAPLPSAEHGIFRPLTLRRMAQRVLERGPLGEADAYQTRSDDVVRIATYNIHSCVGLDGRLSPSRIARVLATASPDIIALQEVDVSHNRSGLVHQAEQVARALNMEMHFHPSFELKEGQYGNAILSRFPMRLRRAGELPCGDRPCEPRGALWVEVDVPSGPLQVITTHLGLSSAERARQVDELLGPRWLGHPDCRGPLVFCGDLNAMPGSGVYRSIASRLRDVQTSIDRHRPQRTWFGPFPLTRIDHMFLNGRLQAREIHIPRTRLARVASDHLPMVVDVELQQAAASGDAANIGVGNSANGVAAR